MAARGRIAASTKVRVFVADEQPLFRDGIRQTLEESDAAELVGEATNAKDALQLIGQLRDLVVLQVQLAQQFEAADFSREARQLSDRKKDF